MANRKKDETGLVAGILGGDMGPLMQSDVKPGGSEMDWAGLETAAGEAFTALRSGNRDAWISAIRSLATMIKDYAGEGE